MGDLTITEEYDGNSWATNGSLGTAAGGLAGCGTQGAGFAAGGTEFKATTEEYNGSSWSAGGNMSAAKLDFEMVGLQTAAVNFGGRTNGRVATTETYDGSSWSTEGNGLAAVRDSHCGAGTSTVALAWGGKTAGSHPDNYLQTSEEWATALTARTLSNS